MTHLRPIRDIEEAAERLAPFDPVVARAMAQKAAPPIEQPVSVSIKDRLLSAMSERPMLIREIAERAGMRARSVSSYVTKLQTLVEHAKNAPSGRAYYWRLFKRGMAYVAALKAQMGAPS